MTRYRKFCSRVHQRVCIPARSCTCPHEYGPEVITEARTLATHIHHRYGHPGAVEHCESPYDVICKAVW